MMDARNLKHISEPSARRNNTSGWLKSFCFSALILTATSQAPVVAAVQKVENGYTAPAQDLPIPNAIQFPIVITKTIDSTHSATDDTVEAKLKEDLVIDDAVVAPAESIVFGHIETLNQSRRMAESVLSSKKRFHKGSSMSIIFDEIVTPDGERLKIVGCLSRQSANFTDNGQPREVEIGAKGEMTKAEAVFTNDQKVAAQAVGFAASSGLNVLGTAASFGALPVVMGVIGAANPDLVSPKPLKKGEKHPRVKGFAFGIWSTVPGAPVLQTIIFKGSDLYIAAGDEFLAQAHSPYDNPAPVLSISSKILTVSKNPKDFKDAKDVKDIKDIKDVKDAKDAKDVKDRPASLPLSQYPASRPVAAPAQVPDAAR